MAERDFKGEAKRESFQEEALKQWIQGRIKTIHDRVSVHDILRRNGVRLRYSSDRAEQISCPFHGDDKKPSCKVHPERNDDPSHVWCYVCQQRWDCITLWKRFTGFEGKFTALLRDMERTFGITTPEVPEGVFGQKDNEEALELQRLFVACENRLLSCKKAFDMRGYLVIGSVLDCLSSNFKEGKVPLETARDTLRRVITKIGEKERACPDV